MNSFKWKKYLIWFLVITLLIVIVIYKFGSQGKDGGDKKPNRERVINVRGMIVKGDFLQNIFVTNGIFLGNEQVELKSETGGRVVDIFFNEGKFVKKGELLLKINDADLKATLKKHLAKEKFLKEKELRIRNLFEKNLASKEDYESIENDLNSTLADIEMTKALIDKTEIRAPFSGVLGLRNVSVGAYINQQTVVSTLTDIEKLKLDFSVPQKYANLIKVGKPVKIRSNNQEIIGKIFAFEPKIDEATKTLKVRAIVENRNKTLYPGAYAEVEIILEELNDAILIPTNAIVPDLDGEKAFIVKEGKARLIPVTIGIRREKDIQIISGVRKGDTLITSGLIQLKDKLPVKVSIVDAEQKERVKK